VEDQDKIQSDDDVEAHKKKTLKAAETDDGGESGSEDFELHKKRSATDEGGESSDDDVELHKRWKK
jgi:hypothetical protein